MDQLAAVLQFNVPLAVFVQVWVAARAIGDISESPAATTKAIMPVPYVFIAVPFLSQKSPSRAGFACDPTLEPGRPRPAPFLRSTHIRGEGTPVPADTRKNVYVLPKGLYIRVRMALRAAWHGPLARVPSPFRGRSGQ